MKFIIHTPIHTATHQITWLEINTPTGNYIILKGHVPMIIPLAMGEPLIFQIQNGAKQVMNVNRGIIKIERNSALVIMSLQT